MASTGIPYFKAWIIFAIVSVLLGFFGGMAIGFVVGFAMGVAGMPIESIQLVCTILGLIVGLVASFATFRWVVDRFIVPAVASPPSNQVS